MTKLKQYLGRNLWILMHIFEKKIENQLSNLISQKEQQIMPKENRKKKILKITEVINETESRCTKKKKGKNSLIKLMQLINS